MVDNNTNDDVDFSINRQVRGRRLITNPIAEAALERQAPMPPSPVTREDIDALEADDLIVKMSRRERLPIEGISDAPITLSDANQDENFYRREYQLKQLHQLLLRGKSAEEICRVMSIPITAYRPLKEELNTRLVNSARKLNPHQMAGEALAFYDTVIEQAMDVYFTVQDDDRGRGVYKKLQALQVATNAQIEKNKFLKEARFWEHSPLISEHKNDDQKYQEEIEVTRNMIEEVLGGLEENVDE